MKQVLSFGSIILLILFSTCSLGVSVDDYRKNPDNNPGTGEKGPLGLVFSPVEDGTAYSVSRGTATATGVVIPAVFNGLPVTTIAANGFQGYTTMTSVTIPDSVTIVGDEAFFNCSSLTSITIPKSVTEIGSAILGGCSKLTSIVVDSDNPEYRSENYCLISKDNVLISACNNSIIPNSVVTIGVNAFCGCAGLTGIIIPQSVTEIDDFAFQNCTGLTSIMLPKNVISIGRAIFAGCTGLTGIATESGSPYWSGGNCVVINNTVITGCRSSIVPQSTFTAVVVHSIGDWAFYRCIGLTTIQFPQGGLDILSIGDYAYNSCTDLTSIVIPNDLSSIGNYAFAGCDHLSMVFYERSSISDWNKIVIGNGNSELTSAARYYKSDTENTDGSHWHYVDNVPTVWE